MNSKFEKLFQLIMNVVKIGIVKRYNPENHTAIVEFKDFESVISREFQIAEPFTHRNKSYMPLREGQKVLCLLLPQSGTTDGFIIGTVYDDDNRPPVEDKNKFHVTFEDGSFLEYDTEKHELTIKVPALLLKGHLEVEGDIHATGAIIDEGGNTPHHTH